MQIRFLLGPAGSGKTFRCLSEIRAALAAAAEGPPLILLAPRQATFQLEQQLLADPAPTGLRGYTRLKILSFERLAEFVFEQLGRPVPELLAEEGRVMVLRALLERKRGELQLFRASARLPGFARQLSELLRELQRYQLAPPQLGSLAERVGDANHLNAKLRDVALIARAYAEWLQQHNLEDADRLLDLAAAALNESKVPGEASNAENLSPRTSHLSLPIAGLWLDGFAQMTPQERQLLAAVAPCAGQTTLAFCLDGEPGPNVPWHSAWAPVTETFLRCRDEFRALPQAHVSIEVLKRNLNQSRFQDQPMLQQLEKSWAKPGEFTIYDLRFTSPTTQQSDPHPAAVRIIDCANPEAEVEFAAREIRRYVREDQGRFRDAAVLLRSLEGYHDSIRRVFTRYEIPFFLDHREAVAHHPLAELTRYALRLVAYGWEHDDWFGALKTGLVHDDDAAIDRLENEALARGWRGKAIWLEPIKIYGTPELSEWIERLRQKLVPAFQQFSDSMTTAQRSPTGAQLSAAFRELWRSLKADRKLERWNAAANENEATLPMAHRPSPIHETVWEQMSEWLNNLQLAFRTEALPLNDWLPIVEAGLGNLSVGAIPPALDQVLVGAIDRSRNPELQLAFVLGVNEGVFPAPPPAPVLLNRADREMLAAHNAPLGPDFLKQIGLERYYGYIACTRARRQLALTYADRNRDGRELNPSSFIGDLRRLFPDVHVEKCSGDASWQSAEHGSELIVPVLRDDSLALRTALRALVPGIESVVAKWEQAASVRGDERLPPGLIEKIYGTELHTSVSGLEDFTACPFKFFAGRGLRAEERREFEIDPREKGSFQHEVLKEFHLRLQRDKKRWRDISPAAARALVRETGEALLPGFRDGLFIAGESRRFTARMLIEGLERLVETLVLWAKQYQFDPAAVEVAFGLEAGGLPAWRIDLDGTHALLLRGRIDRVDLCRVTETGETLGVVIDYKSSARQLDPVLLHHGLELQLLGYLGALSQIQNLDAELNVSQIIPAGAFYVALKGGGGSAKTREAEREGREYARREGWQHRGRFDGGHLLRFDPSGAAKGDQFRYSKNKDATFARRGNEALSSADFRALVTHVENFLRQHGRDIYAGKVEVAPYRWKNETACDFCKYRPVCRFDPWTQLYRVLRPPPK